MPCNPNNAAQALLLVSGGHVLREISSPFFGSQMMSSFDMLRSARHLREIGSINKSTGLWAVENPLTNHPERLEQKLEAGAEAVITQPPVLWEKFEQWWMHSVQRGLIGSTSDLKVIVGLPVIGSLRTLEFWQKLTKTQHSPESKRLLFNLSESIGKGNEDVLYEWNRDLALKVKALPGVSGAHIMPLNQAGVAQTRRLIEENII